MNRSATVRVGLLQQMVGEDKAQNIERAVAGIRDLADQGAQVILLQELFASRYFCQEEDPRYFELGEELEGPCFQAVSKIAKEKGICVITGIFERRAPGLYHNSVLVIGPEGTSLGLYRKMHIPDDPQYMEKFYFTPGDLGYIACETPFGKLGLLICWDQWYPEAARLTSMLGADLLFYPTAIGWIPEEKAELGEAQLNAWQTMMRSHAIANGVYVVAANRVGFEPSGAGGIEFWGHSFVAAPDGRIIAEAGVEEAALVVECDLKQTEEQRRWWPFFRDRRIDSYDGLSSRWLDQKQGPKS